MKTKKILFWVFTGLLSVMMLASSIGYYLMKTEEVKQIFTDLGFPTWIVIPLAIAKILGVITLLTRFNEDIVEWAYAGFFFNFMLALGAHFAANDGEHWTAAVALVLLLGSRFFYEQIWDRDS